MADMKKVYDDLMIINLYPELFNHELFNHELFNHELFNPGLSNP